MADANRTAPSGIARDIANKIAKNRDQEAEAKAVAWMTQVVGHPPPAGDYDEALKNGVYLCELMNAIVPNTIKKIHAKGQTFVMMQNVEAFSKAIIAYGVPMEDVFQTVDLSEKRNIPAVTKCIYALARVAHEKHGWSGPELKIDKPKPKE